MKRYKKRQTDRDMESLTMGKILLKNEIWIPVGNITGQYLESDPHFTM